MRKTLILLVVSLLLLWATQSFAFYKGIAKPKFGDPDEFQTQKYHDETGQRLPCYCRAREDTLRRTPPRGDQASQNVRRYLTISFAGRTFFLEK